MKNFLYVAAFALVVSLFYTGVGQLLPQLPSYPPKEVKLGEATLSNDEVIEAGAGIFEANCAQCHKIGRTDRCPDLAGVGARAKERAAERKAATSRDYSEADYLYESVCKPGDYLVKGFANIMPPQGKVLSPGQIVAVVAFLQDQGGSVTASLSDKAGAETALQKFGCSTGAGGGAAVVAAVEPVGPPEKIFTSFGCVGCHSIDQPTRLIGPSLKDVGKRLQKPEIFESVLAPDETIAKGDPAYPQGLMKATLEGNGFYERMTPADYRALVDWLAKHQG